MNAAQCKLVPKLNREQLQVPRSVRTFGERLGILSEFYQNARSEQEYVDGDSPLMGPADFTPLLQQQTPDVTHPSYGRLGAGALIISILDTLGAQRSIRTASSLGTANGVVNRHVSLLRRWRYWFGVPAQSALFDFFPFFPFFAFFSFFGADCIEESDDDALES